MRPPAENRVAVRTRSFRNVAPEENADVRQRHAGEPRSVPDAADKPGRKRRRTWYPTPGRTWVSRSNSVDVVAPEENADARRRHAIEPRPVPDARDETDRKRRRTWHQMPGRTWVSSSNSVDVVVSPLNRPKFSTYDQNRAFRVIVASLYLYTSLIYILY